MAGVADNIQLVSSDKSEVLYDGESELTFNLSTTDTASLQELIDSELALRIGNVEQDELELESSGRFLEAERSHTSSTLNTLNIFSDTIDLSPDCEPQSPLFPLSPSVTSPQFENRSLASDPDLSDACTPVAQNVESDESPVSEDVSDLEPIPLFTQTITSDNEPSPLSEINSFVRETSPPIDEVLVVIEPPDDSTPNSDDSPKYISSPKELEIEKIVEKLEDVSREDSINVNESELYLVSQSDNTNFPKDYMSSIIEVETINGSQTETIPYTLVESEQQTLVFESYTKEDSTDSVDASVCNSMHCESVVANTELLSDWTTVEEATKGVDESEDSVLQTEDMHSNITESVTTTTSTTKMVKKKKSTDGVDSRIKKTKKTKKSEEKENHISVITNGHSVSPKESPVSSPDEEYELGSVCVRDLRRSFCDLQKEPAASHTPVNASQLKARSLGDLRCLCELPQHRTIHTGVSVKALKSSFSKFDQLQKSVLHVRSSDPSKIQKQIEQETADSPGANPSCKSCGKTVFAMEQVKAERSVWHKNCFRCKECSKQLTVDIYQSHEGELYCKPHFRELFKPKAVLDSTDDEPSSDKADLGLEELTSLNVKSRFQVFEKTKETEVERCSSTINVKRSPSILSKLAKFQKKGMDVGVTDESLNGVGYEESSSSEEEAQGDDGPVVKSSKLPEKPMSFNKMEDVKRTWESSGSTKTKDELRAEHKKEINQIRSRLFQGKQGKMKEMYEQAVAESEGKGVTKNQDIIQSEKARLLKERFERGEVAHSDSEDEVDKKSKPKETDDLSVFEAGISKKSRSIFLELDATAAKVQTSPLTPPLHVLVPRTTDRRSSQMEDSPDKEIYRDPDVVRSEDTVEDETIVKRSQTASRMLSLFRQMEEQKETVPDGPKPLKCFTPPPDYKEDQSGTSEEEEEESEEEEVSEDDTTIVKSSAKIEDEFLKQAQNAARAKALKEKFEHWEPEKHSVNNAINFLESEQESIESTKSLRARFESLKAEQPKGKPRPKVNRFVLLDGQAVNKCVSCEKTVYPLEKVEVDGKIYHANCFRCQQCQCKLRMDTYTLNNDQLYCLPHFRQLFIAKGNYDEGFGSNQHKRKWEVTVNAHH